jgi:hypothetical protein
MKNYVIYYTIIKEGFSELGSRFKVQGSGFKVQGKAKLGGWKARRLGR